MKSTGIVRRIDELGRVVIPKELRRTMRLREGEEMEVFTDSGGELIFKKYSALKGIKEYGEELASSITNIINKPVVITDKDNVIVDTSSNQMYLDKRISYKFERAMEKRRAVLYKGSDAVQISDENINDVVSMVIAPVVYQGDILGALAIISKNNVMADTEIKLAEIATDFLSKQV
ncbi:MAG: stage V sporulation T C-terminal domain-containing protein [Christensenellales bacterium]